MPSASPARDETSLARSSPEGCGRAHEPLEVRHRARVRRRARIEHLRTAYEEGPAEDEGVAHGPREPHAEARCLDGAPPHRRPEELSERPSAEPEGQVESFFRVRDGTRLRPTLREELLAIFGAALVDDEDREVVPGLAEVAE